MRDIVLETKTEKFKGPQNKETIILGELEKMFPVRVPESNNYYGHTFIIDRQWPLLCVKYKWKFPVLPKVTYH